MEQPEPGDRDSTFSLDAADARDVREVPEGDPAMRDIDDVVKRAVEKKRDQFAQEQIDAARGPVETPQLVSEYCESRFCVRSRGHTGNCKDATGLEEIGRA